MKRLPRKFKKDVQKLSMIIVNNDKKFKTHFNYLRMEVFIYNKQTKIVAFKSYLNNVRHKVVKRCLNNGNTPYMI